MESFIRGQAELTKNLIYEKKSQLQRDIYNLMSIFYEETGFQATVESSHIPGYGDICAKEYITVKVEI